MSSVRDALRGGREPRHVTSIVHPDRTCQQCTLCKKRDLSKYSHPKSWKNPCLLQQLQAAEPSLNIQPESCICLLCRKDVSSMSDGSFSPRCRKSTYTVKLCYIPDCQNSCIKLTKSVNVQELARFFSMENDDANDDSTEDIPLCSHHYMQWYRHIHTPQTNCKTCGKKLRNYS